MSLLIKAEFSLAACGEFCCWDTSVLKMEEEPASCAVSGCCQLSPLFHFQHLEAHSYASTQGAIKKE